MKVWFVGQNAAHAMGLGEYASTSGPYRSLDEAVAAAKNWEGEGEVAVYEAIAVCIVTVEVERRVREKAA